MSIPPNPQVCMAIEITGPQGVIGVDNQWMCTIICSPQLIFAGAAEYTVADVAVGMWVTNQSGGTAWQIYSIISRDFNVDSLLCVIEDVELYNNSTDPDGTYSAGPQDGASGLLWTLGENGLPNLYPLAAQTLPITFVTDLICRFSSRDYSGSFVNLQQDGSSFKVGQCLTINQSNQFEAITSNTPNPFFIGMVSSAGYPKDGYFTIRPLGRYFPYYQMPVSLDGICGTLFYLDSSGSITSTSPGRNAYPIFIQLTNKGDALMFPSRLTSIPYSVSGGSSGVLC